MKKLLPFIFLAALAGCDQHRLNMVCLKRGEVKLVEQHDTFSVGYDSKNRYDACVVTQEGH